MVHRQKHHHKAFSISKKEIEEQDKQLVEKAKELAELEAKLSLSAESLPKGHQTGQMDEASFNQKVQELQDEIDH